MSVLELYSLNRKLWTMGLFSTDLIYAALTDKALFLSIFPKINGSHCVEERPIYHSGI